MSYEIDYSALRDGNKEAEQALGRLVAHLNEAPVYAEKVADALSYLANLYDLYRGTPARERECLPEATADPLSALPEMMRLLAVVLDNPSGRSKSGMSYLCPDSENDHS
jgi:hypothetical protein